MNKPRKTKPKLFRLPSGDWIMKNNVIGVTVEPAQNVPIRELTHGPRALVHCDYGRCHVVNFATLQEAQAWADEFAKSL